MQMCSPSLASVSQGQCAHQSAPIGLDSVSHGVPVDICVSPSQLRSTVTWSMAPGSLRRRSLCFANTSPTLWTQDDHTFLDIPFTGPIGRAFEECRCNAPDQTHGMHRAHTTTTEPTSTTATPNGSAITALHPLFLRGPSTARCHVDTVGNCCPGTRCAPTTRWPPAIRDASKAECVAPVQATVVRATTATPAMRFSASLRRASPLASPPAAPNPLPFPPKSAPFAPNKGRRRLQKNTDFFVLLLAGVVLDIREGQPRPSLRVLLCFPRLPS